MADTLTRNDLQKEFDDYTRLVHRLAEERQKAKNDATRRWRDIEALAIEWIEERATYDQLEAIGLAFVKHRSSTLDNAEVLALLSIADEARFVKDAFGHTLTPKQGDYQTWFREVGRRYHVMRGDIELASD